MLQDARVQAFLATTNPERSRAFFEGVLGFPLVSDDPFGLVFDLGPGSLLRVPKMAEFTPQPFTVLGWHVEDVAATVNELITRGVLFERYPGMDQDELGIWTPPGGGSVAWFRDPEGNLLSISGGE